MVTIRSARPGDAAQISALYQDAYRPAGGGSARDHYPFPQFLNPVWVAAAVRRDDLCWVIAEAAGTVVASAGALQNIGSADDRIGEVFGVVVQERTRHRGVGTGVLGFLYGRIAPRCAFVICEARTALAGGWKVARRNGFVPVGFEPFAHATPAGSEPMLPTARLSPGLMELRAFAGPTSRRVGELAGAVLPPGDAGAGIADMSGYPWPGQPSAEPIVIRVGRDDGAGRDFLRGVPGAERHVSGVASLNRLEGEDPDGQRYEERGYVVELGPEVVGGARVVIDRVDRRARVLGLRVVRGSFHGQLFAAITDELRREGPAKVRTVAVDVRADHPRLQATLEALGFIPTIYYPALLAHGSRRMDAVQYTNVFGQDIASTLDCMDRLNWPRAEGVVDTVVSAFRAVAPERNGARGGRLEMGAGGARRPARRGGST